MVSVEKNIQPQIKIFLLNLGVCKHHCLLKDMFVMCAVLCLVAQSCPTLAIP